MGLLSEFPSRNQFRGPLKTPKPLNFVGTRKKTIPIRFRRAEKVSLGLSYSSPGKSMLVELTMVYDPFSPDLKKEYDRLFPEEQGMWGRSSPAFPQAIRDYMRGQAHSSNLVELRDHGKTLYIRIGIAGLGSDGFLSCLQRASLEFRKGLLHADVLFHIFAS